MKMLYNKSLHMDGSFVAAHELKRYMSKIIYIFIFLLLISRPALSCSYNEYPTFDEAVKSEPILLLAKVIDVSVNEKDIYETKVTISVIEIIKGKDLNTKTITLFSWPCFTHIALLDLKDGHEYIIPLNDKKVHDGEFMFLNNIRTLVEHMDGQLYTVAGQIERSDFYMSYEDFKQNMTYNKSLQSDAPEARR